MSSFLGSGFQILWTFPAGPGEEISRRIRLCGQKPQNPASRGQKIGKTTCENIFLTFVFSFLLFDGS